MMVQGNDLELQGQSALPLRRHEIVLCCAQSVHAMVEEVAHNLAGLGFRSRVVCGAEARSAVLGREREGSSDEPTIYVICVQGALKDQVLDPLRQALATHGGPNEHLFVAVLDLALPLAMVQQIRRFADSIERTTPKQHPGERVAERRQWREHFGRSELDAMRTRAHAPVGAVDRTVSKAGVIATKTGGIRRSAQGRRVVPSKSFRIITGSSEASTSVSTRRRGRRGHASGSGRHRAVRQRRAAEAKARSRAPALDSMKTSPELRPHGGSFGPAVAAPSGARRWLVSGVVVTIAIAAAWMTGFGEPLIEDLIERVRTVRGYDASFDSGEAALSVADHQSRIAGDREVVQAQALEHEIEIEDTDEIEIEDDEAIERPSIDVFEDLVAQSRLRKVRNLYVSPKQGQSTTWEDARERCKQLEVEGIGGWRLPHRRELKVLAVAGFLAPDLTFWSFTRVDEDPGMAYALDASSRELVQYLQQEPSGDVICVLAQ